MTVVAFCHVAFASGADEQRHLSAVFSYGTFYHPSAGSYIETYISFDAWTLNFVPVDGKRQATIEMLVKISDEDSIIFVKKYALNSPKIDMEASDRFNFIDVQRIAIPSGVHKLEITLHDKNSTDAATVVSETVAVYYGSKKTALSSLQMISSLKPTEQENILSRYGYDIEPYANDFIPQQIEELLYFYEIYNIDRETRDENIYAFSHIEVKETGRVLEETESAKAYEVGELIPVFGSIDISQLESGNYNLVVEVRSKDNEIMLYRRLPFVRSNPGVEHQETSLTGGLLFTSNINDEKVLNEYVEALAPLANEMERREIYEIIHRPGIEEKQIFIQRFFERREGLSAESAWREYRDRIDYVNANFSLPNFRGYRTDRGRVYLQYGPPNFVRDEKNFSSIRHMGGGVNINRTRSVGESEVKDLQSPTVATEGQIFYLPYQLWRYDNIPGDDVNRCFIFWDEFRMGLYKLLNSNARGEVREMDWERRLSQGQLGEGEVGDVGEQFNRGH